jgi:hypothetical protein
MSKIKKNITFVAVVMAMATFISCEDRLLDDNINAGVKTLNTDCIYNMMYLNGDYDYHFKHLTLAFYTSMHYSHLFRGIVLHEFSERGNVILLKHLISEEGGNEHWQYMRYILRENMSVDISFFLTYYLNMQITLESDIEVLSSDISENIAVFYKPASYMLGYEEDLYGYGYGYTSYEHVYDVEEGLFIQFDPRKPYEGHLIVIGFTTQTDGIIILGDEGEDPYAIHNMEQARLNLMDEGIYLPEVEANHEIYPIFTEK